MSRFSFSRIELFLNCPYKYKLRYIDNLDTLPDYDSADHPLTIGSAMHHGIEQGVDSAIKEYINSYPIDTTEIETEALKLQILIPKVRQMINTDGFFELRIETKDFLGFVDYIDPETHTLLDFKYSNNRSHYLKSPQVHLYKFLVERLYGMRIDRIGYLFIPKLKDERKNYPTEALYREHIKVELEKLQPEIEYVTYDENKVRKTLSVIERINAEKEFSKNENRLCWYCDYRRYCESDGKEDFMILPKNERRKAGVATSRKLWIYGAPFSGKTTFCDNFPDVLMLNTDGNTKYVTAPVVRIKDEVKTEGHITRSTIAWKVFKDTIDELAKCQNDFKTIVVDLIEDTYEYCRLYMYDQLGISHESDNSFKAWDMVRTEFLSTIKRLMNLNYENIILVSHEDMSKDITKRGGDSITAIRPNIQDKIANKLAGMVDAVMRCVVIDGNHRLAFKSDEVVFGGGRINFIKNEIPLSYDEFVKIYETSIADATPETVTKELPETPQVEVPDVLAYEPQEQKEEVIVKDDTPEPAPVRRRRRRE